MKKSVAISRLDERLTCDERRLESLTERCEHFIKQDEFRPIREMFYKMIYTVLAVVLLGVLALVVKMVK